MYSIILLLFILLQDFKNFLTFPVDGCVFSHLVGLASISFALRVTLMLGLLINSCYLNSKKSTQFFTISAIS